MKLSLLQYKGEVREAVIQSVLKLVLPGHARKTQLIRKMEAKFEKTIKDFETWKDTESTVWMPIHSLTEDYKLLLVTK